MCKPQFSCFVCVELSDLSLVLTARLVWSFEFFLLETRVQLSSKLEETEGGEKNQNLVILYLFMLFVVAAKVYKTSKNIHIV